MFLLKNFQCENSIKLTGLPFISTSCAVDSKSCTVTETNVQLKSCKVHMKSSRKLKNVHIEDCRIVSRKCTAQM